MNRSDKDLVVTHIISGDLWAGAEVQVYNLCKALKTSGKAAPTVVVFNQGILHEKLKDLGLPITLADEKRLGPIAIARSIASHCKHQNTKIVHTHGFKENVLGILGKELAKVSLSVRTVHGNQETAFSPAQPHKWVISQLDIFLGRLRQQAVIAVSTQLEKKLEPMFPGKVHKIFNFVDVDDIRARWPVKGQLEGAAYKIGIVGRLVPVKRVDIFIRTIALINKRGLSCTGVIIGTGPLEAQLRQLADHLKISDQIDFKGFVNPALEELQKLDVLLMTSDHEGLPMTLLEAMALEVPIVAHKVGGIPEILEDGKSGWLVTEHSEDRYAAVTSDLLGSNENVEQKTKAGLLNIKSLFDSAVNAEQYNILYNKLAKKG